MKTLTKILGSLIFITGLPTTAFMLHPILGVFTVTMMGLLIAASSNASEREEVEDETIEDGWREVAERLAYSLDRHSAGGIEWQECDEEALRLFKDMERVDQ